MTTQAPPRKDSDLHVAADLPDALSALAERSSEGIALAGGTWVMRARLRGEPWNRAYVAIAGIPELGRIDITDREIRVGACVTHAELARVLESVPGYLALKQAASGSANPAVREMATIGGNLSAVGFAAADLPPALTVLRAHVDIASAAGVERLTIEDFLRFREHLQPGSLLSRVVIPRSAWSSAHVRLPLRKAGDYPVAIVSIALKRDGDRVADARVSVGSVEVTAKRWHSLEEELVGSSHEPAAISLRAADLLGDFNAREGSEAPGWYRKQVLPVLAARALTALG